MIHLPKHSLTRNQRLSKNSIPQKHCQLNLLPITLLPSYFAAISEACVDFSVTLSRNQLESRMSGPLPGSKPTEIRPLHSNRCNPSIRLATQPR
jgi:hypothetical protein